MGDVMWTWNGDNAMVVRSAARRARMAWIRSRVGQPFRRTSRHLKVPKPLRFQVCLVRQFSSRHLEDSPRFQ
jgi:hypothetical protein